MINFQVRMQEDGHKETLALFDELKQAGKVTTLGGFVEELVECYKHPRVVENVELQAEAEDLKKKYDELISEYERSKGFVTTLQNDLEKLHVTHSELIAEHEQSKLNETQLHAQLEACTNAIKSTPQWDKISKSMNPFPVVLLEATAQKLSTRYNREVSPMQILTDMFMRYTIERWSEWFYPFCITDSEIVEIAKQINPDIENINQIRKTLNNGK